jgi:endonuclease/exonuclease/phosphatase family metal-dependent hydrolase
MRIATYNLGLLDIQFFGKTVFEFAPFTRIRAKSIPQALVGLNCDVLCVQELYHAEDASAITLALAKNLPFSICSKTSRSPLKLGHGLAIFSKHPIQDTNSVQFKTQLLDEQLIGPKGFLYANIQSPKFGELGIATLHTTAGGFFHHPESKKANRCRHNQLVELTTFIQSKNALTFMAGDFNCGPEVSQQNFETVLGSGFNRLDSCAIRCDDGPTWDPQNSLNISSPHKTSPPQRIDHVLATEALSSKLLVESAARIFTETTLIKNHSHTLSDHYGLLVTARKSSCYEHV